MTISAEHLCKYYGNKISVEDMSFSLDEHAVLGFIGPNGAGKTTTMRMLCGIMPPSSGDVLIDGASILNDPVAAKRKIGYLPENAPLHGSMCPFLSYILRAYARALRKETDGGCRFFH